MLTALQIGMCTYIGAFTEDIQGQFDRLDYLETKSYQIRMNTFEMAKQTKSAYKEIIELHIDMLK